MDVPKKERKKNYRDDEFLEKLGMRIGEIRLQKGLSQENLAFECNDADFSQINRIELGKVIFSISYLKLIAEKLEVTVSDLLNSR